MNIWTDRWSKRPRDYLKASVICALYSWVIKKWLKQLKFVTKVMAAPQHGKCWSNSFRQIYYPQVFMHPIFTNIPMILANFLNTIIQFLWKTSVTTMGTLIAGQPFALQAKMAWKYPTKYTHTKYLVFFYLVVQTRWIVRMGHCHIVIGSLEVCRLFSLVIICSLSMGFFFPFSIQIYIIPPLHLAFPWPEWSLTSPTYDTTWYFWCLRVNNQSLSP